MTAKKIVAIMCGGASYEHEVSIISGIQIAQNIDRKLYKPVFLYFDQADNVFLIKNFSDNKKDFLKNKRIPVNLIRGVSGLQVQPKVMFTSNTVIDVVFLAFHGGTGESGAIQGLLELYKTPFTAAGQEGAVVAMNKAITKEALVAHDVPVLPWVSILSESFHQDKVVSIKEILDKLSLPLIIKPVHLGSSIGITIAKTEVELGQQLSIAARLDSEILLEPALDDFTEFNISVRSATSGLEFSPIEEPIREGEVLSFDDKYANGGKKGGDKGSNGGMELLGRTVPAKIPDELAEEIRGLAAKVYRACRLSGMLRIDFMYSKGKLYCTEPNPIPGSLAFYLWEAAGETFQQQITQAIEDSLDRHSKKIVIEPYETDIVEKFVG
ncbi:MAG: D-alanine-D-alanine ligase [Candidatus Paceibacteria bacterium]|jgi:D-alanine-D-alanine ligase